MSLSSSGCSLLDVDAERDLAPGMGMLEVRPGVGSPVVRGLARRLGVVDVDRLRVIVALSTVVRQAWGFYYSRGGS
jgi:hypothetical protein